MRGEVGVKEGDEGDSYFSPLQSSMDKIYVDIMTGEKLLSI